MSEYDSAPGRHALRPENETNATTQTQVLQRVMEHGTTVLEPAASVRVRKSQGSGRSRLWILPELVSAAAKVIVTTAVIAPGINDTNSAEGKFTPPPAEKQGGGEIANVPLMSQNDELATPQVATGRAIADFHNR